MMEKLFSFISLRKKNQEKQEDKSCLDCCFCAKEGVDLDIPGAPPFQLTEEERNAAKQEHFDFLKCLGCALVCAEGEWTFLGRYDEGKLRSLKNTKCVKFIEHEAVKGKTLSAIRRARRMERHKMTFWFVLIIAGFVVGLLWLI